MNTDDLMIVDPAGLDRHELRRALRQANDQIVALSTAHAKYEKAIAYREQVGTDLIGFVEGVLKAHLRGDATEIAKIAEAYFTVRPRYRERLEEDIQSAAALEAN